MKELMTYLHLTFGHTSIRQLRTIFFKNYYRPNTQPIAHKVVHSCLLCAKGKIQIKLNFKSGVARTFDPTGPRQSISIDLLPGLPTTSDNFTAALLICDSFSKFLSVVPLKSISANTVRIALQQYFQTMGLHVRIYSDADAVLQAAVKQIQEDYSVSYMQSPSYTQNANCVEQSWRTLKN